MSAGPLVDAPAGALRGAVDRREPSVTSYLGIPYARPPVGALRLRRAVRAEPWAGERAALEFGSRCVQAPSLLAPSREAQSEDCLFLNVWSPLDAAAEPGGHPVMVWFHGGGFTSGSGAIAWYHGSRLAARGVVVVTVNYRLGPFGFLHLESVGGEAWQGSANLGLSDQSLALEWVRDNVATFGGDPSRVCIFGESAGAMSVAAHLARPGSAGLFRAAIAQSGSATHVQSDETAARTAAAVIAEIGCSSRDLDRIGDVPSEVLLAAASALEGRIRGDGLPLPFQPTVDGSTLPVAPVDALADGMAGDVALMVGTTSEEMKLFTLMAGLGRSGTGDLDRDRLRARIERFAPAMGHHGIDADAVREAYAGALGTGDGREIWSAIMTDLVFGVPAEETVDAQLRGGGPAWSYLFTHPSSAFEGALGAAHATEIPYVFDNLDQPGTEFLLGPSDRRRGGLAAVMADAWVSFARTAKASWQVRDHQPVGARRPTMVFDLDSEQRDDPWGERRRVWMGR